VLTGPGKKRVSDEAIFESIVSDYTAAKEERARLRHWQDNEVANFVQYFHDRKPEDTVRETQAFNRQRDQQQAQEAAQRGQDDPGRGPKL